MTQKLHDLGQSLWLDRITRDLLNNGMLKHYIDDLSLSGLTSNPNVFDSAIRDSSVYDVAIRKKLKEEKSGEELYFELGLDLGHAADLLRPIYDQTDGADGWVSLEVSPLLTHDADSILAAAVALYARGQRPNFFITIPGTKEGLPAVEEAIFAGVPVNVTYLVFFARTLPGGRRGVPARYRTSDCRRSQTKHKLRRLDVYQALGTILSPTGCQNHSATHLVWPSRGAPTNLTVT